MDTREPNVVKLVNAIVEEARKRVAIRSASHYTQSLDTILEVAFEVMDERYARAPEPGYRVVLERGDE